MVRNCDDTVLQSQDAKFEPWRSEAEHAISRSRRLPTIPTFTRGWGRNIFCSFQTAENRTPNSGVKGSAVLTTTLGPTPTRRCILSCRVYCRPILTGQSVDFTSSSFLSVTGHPALPPTLTDLISFLDSWRFFACSAANEVNGLSGVI